MAMVTEEQLNCSHTYNRSIVKEIVHTESVESGCKSADEDDAGVLHSSTDFDLSLRTVVGGSAHDLRDTDIHCSTNNTSTESIPRRYTFASTELPRTQVKLQILGHERLESLSPNSLLTNEDDKLRSIISTQSQSYDTLPLAPLHETTTGDSGTGDSLIQIPTETSTPAVHYDVVPVYGLEKLVLIKNRYAFDPAKIIAYRNRKRLFLPAKSSRKPPHSGNVNTPESDRQDSRESKKLTGVFSRLRRIITPTPSDQLPFVPVTRHHSANTTPDENH